MARKHSEFLKFEKGVYENPHTMSLLLLLSLFSHEKSRIREDPTQTPGDGVRLFLVVPHERTRGNGD